MSQDRFIWRTNLEGDALLLRSLIEEDFEALYTAASDPLIWEQHPSNNRWQREVFASFFKDGLASNGALVVIDKSKNQIIGTSRYYDYDSQKKEVAIGFTFLARAYWGGATNAELKRLMIENAFRRVNTIWFHVGPDNVRSQKAMEKIGAKFSHRAMKELNGGSVDYFFYRMDRVKESS
jgi:N-acetyltransferase